MTSEDIYEAYFLSLFTEDEYGNKIPPAKIINVAFLDPENININCFPYYDKNTNKFCSSIVNDSFVCNWCVIFSEINESGEIELFVTKAAVFE